MLVGLKPARWASQVALTPNAGLLKCSGMHAAFVWNSYVVMRIFSDQYIDLQRGES